MNYEKILNMVNFLHNLLLSKFNEFFKILSKPENLIFYIYILFISFLLLLVIFISINFELIEAHQTNYRQNDLVVRGFESVNILVERYADVHVDLEIEILENEILKDAVQQSKDRYFYLDTWCIVLLVVALYFSS